MIKKYSVDDFILWTLCLFAFSVVFSVTAVEGALFLTLALMLVKRYKEQTLSEVRPYLTGHPLFIPWMIYLGVCLLTGLTAYYPGKAMGQLNSDFLKYVCLFTLFLAVKKEHLQKMSLFYTCAAIISGLIGIYTASVSIYSGDAEVKRATFDMNAVRYGEVMGLALTLALSRAIIPIKESFQRERLFYILAIFPIFIALVLSQTRGAYLGIITGIAVMLYFASPSRQKVLLYTGVLAVTAGLVTIINPEIRYRFTAIFHRNEAEMLTNTPSTAINIRLELWKLGADMFRAHPVLGVGPDNIRKVFKKFHPGPIGYQETWGSLHNLYLHQAAERGILGLAALATLFTAMFLFAKRRFRELRSPFTLWALCALPAYYVMNFTEISFQHVHTSFAIFMALAAAAAENTAAEDLK